MTLSLVYVSREQCLTCALCAFCWFFCFYLHCLPCLCLSCTSCMILILNKIIYKFLCVYWLIAAFFFWAPREGERVPACCVCDHNINCSWEFYSIYNLGTVGHSDKLITFQGRWVKGQSCSETKCTFLEEAHQLMVHCQRLYTVVMHTF